MGGPGSQPHLLPAAAQGRWPAPSTGSSCPSPVLPLGPLLPTRSPRGPRPSWPSFCCVFPPEAAKNAGWKLNVFPRGKSIFNPGLRAFLPSGCWGSVPVGAGGLSLLPPWEMGDGRGVGGLVGLEGLRLPCGFALRLLTLLLVCFLLFLEKAFPALNPRQYSVKMPPPPRSLPGQPAFPCSLCSHGEGRAVDWTSTAQGSNPGPAAVGAEQVPPHPRTSLRGEGSGYLGRQRIEQQLPPSLASQEQELSLPHRRPRLSA